LKAFRRELTGDFKAAVRIGDPESVESVMDRVRTAPDDFLPPSALLPLGESVKDLPAEILLAWLDDEDPAVRGIAAAAIGLQDPSGNRFPGEALIFAADDPVDEVRSALVDGLAANPIGSGEWVGQFLAAESLPVRRAGLLRARKAQSARYSIRLLDGFDGETDHALRDELVALLNHVAERVDPEAVLSMLGGWVDREEPNIWVITRVLSASWAQGHTERSTGLLTRLSEKVGDNRPIARALERHTGTADT
jgi:hypothetical protein